MYNTLTHECENGLSGLKVFLGTSNQKGERAGFGSCYACMQVIGTMAG